MTIGLRAYSQIYGIRIRYFKSLDYGMNCIAFNLNTS